MHTPLDNPTLRISVEVNGSLLTRDVECRKHLSTSCATTAA